MRLMLFVTLVISTLAALADGHASTQTEITIAGFDITRFGGPVGTLSLRTTILGNALDLEPAPEFGLYAAAARITFNGVSEDSEGWLQLRNRPNEDALIFTVRFPGEALPGQALNTAISGIELHFTDPLGAMLTSTDPVDIPPDFAARFETFSYALRVGGWSAGEGEWHDFTGDSAASASFLSSSIQVAAVPAPASVFTMLSALIALGTLASLLGQFPGFASRISAHVPPAST